MALLAAPVSRAVEPMSSVARTPIPSALERVVERCMAKDPAARYASTRELLDALSSLSREPPAGAEPAPAEAAR